MSISTVFAMSTPATKTQALLDRLRGDSAAAAAPAVDAQQGQLRALTRGLRSADRTFTTNRLALSESESQLNSFF